MALTAGHLTLDILARLGNGGDTEPYVIGTVLVPTTVTPTPTGQGTGVTITLDPRQFKHLLAKALRDAADSILDDLRTAGKATTDPQGSTNL